MKKMMGDKEVLPSLEAAIKRGRKKSTDRKGGDAEILPSIESAIKTKKVARSHLAKGYKKVG